MKHSVRVSQITGKKQGLKSAAPLLIAAGLFTGCGNYTTAPLCNSENLVELDGITGTYSFSTQDPQSYAVSTDYYEVSQDGKGTLTYKNDEEEETQTELCSIGGKLIQETWSSKTNLYSQERFYLTGMGMTTLKMMYNKPGLDAAGIPTEIVEIPDEAEEFMGKPLTRWVQSVAYSFVKMTGQTRLVIDNRDVPAHQILKESAVAPAGLTLIRE